MLNGKATIVLLKVFKTEIFWNKYKSLDKLDLSNYAIKAYLKNATGVD